MPEARNFISLAERTPVLATKPKSEGTQNDNRKAQPWEIPLFSWNHRVSGVFVEEEMNNNMNLASGWMILSFKAPRDGP